MTVVGWALAVLVPLALAWGIVADARAQAAHDRFMVSLQAGGVR